MTLHILLCKDQTFLLSFMVAHSKVQTNINDQIKILLIEPDHCISYTMEIWCQYIAGIEWSSDTVFSVNVKKDKAIWTKSEREISDSLQWKNPIYN